MPSTPGLKRLQLSQKSAIGLNRSAFTYQTQVQEFQGQMWLGEVTLPVMVKADAENWHSFLLSLNGPLGTFYLYDPLARTPQGAATGTPLMNGTQNPQQSYIVTDGWTPSTSQILKAGDYLQIGQRLHKVLQDVNSDGSGNVTIDIFPKLRETAADNSAIVTYNAKGLFRLTSTENIIVGVDELQIYEVAFSVIEAV